MHKRVIWKIGMVVCLLAAGHSREFTSLDGEIIREAGSLSYDALDEVQFSELFPKMMAV